MRRGLGIGIGGRAKLGCQQKQKQVKDDDNKWIWDLEEEGGFQHRKQRPLRRGMHIFHKTEV
jgi:hypothetical protein